MNFGTLFRKELTELVRSLKILFVPLVFVVLAVGQPVAFKLLPTIIENAGNLPEGAVIQMPVPRPGEVMASVLGQMSQMGILLLILVSMGTIAGERATGVAATVLTKPVGRGAYVVSKALAFGILAAISLFVAIGVSGYYTGILIGPINWGNTLLGALLYLPNLLLAVASTIAFSTFLPGSVAAGGAGLVSVILLNTLPRLLGEFGRKAFPPRLTSEATAVIVGGPATEIAIPLIVTMGLVIAFILLGWQALRRQEV